MITLPDAAVVAGQIREALDFIAVGDRASSLSDMRAWFPAIAEEIAKRFEQPGLQCWARRAPAPCVDKEWMFDFCALLVDEELPPDERFVAQAVAIGEIEWGMKPWQVDEDFEKLFVADALVLFLVFERSQEKAQAELDRLEKAARRRQDLLRSRGMTRVPVFLLSCWTGLEGPFVHRQV